MSDRIRFKVYGQLYDFERRADTWLCLAVGNDGKRAPADFVIPGFVQEDELAQHLFDLFHEHASWSKGGIVRVL